MNGSTDVVIVHRRRDSQPAAFSFHNPQWFIWETCVRRLAFGSESFGVEKAEDGDEVYTGQNAFRFLLEIVCGLHSPVRGETEVHGQFRQFLKSIPQDSWLKPFLDKTHLQARRVRDEFLRDLGSQSYGSLARRKFRECDGVDIVGGGQLVRDVLPWLLKMGHPVRIWVRSPEKMAWTAERYSPVLLEKLTICALADFERKNGGESGLADERRGLMIAAPIEAKDLKPWAEKAQCILDFRADSATDRIADLISKAAVNRAHILTLNDIFSEIEATRGRVDQQTQRALEHIGALALDHNKRYK